MRVSFPETPHPLPFSETSERGSLKLKLAPQAKKMKGLKGPLFSGELGETAAETSEPKYSRALPLLEKKFK